MPVTQKMMICSSSSFVSLSSDKLSSPKLGDKEFPAGTARPRHERRQETTTAAPTVNCMSANCSAWRDFCSSLSFPAYKGIKHRASKLVKLDEEIGVIILPTVFESERRPELLFGCLLIDQRSERAARSSWQIPLTTPPLTCFLLQSPILTVRTPPFSARHRHQKWTPQATYASKVSLNRLKRVEEVNE